MRYRAIETKDPKRARYVMAALPGGVFYRRVTDLAKAVTDAKRQGKSYIVGWKKVQKLGNWNHSLIAKLHIPVNAQMRSPENSKCCTSRAKVVALYECVQPSPFSSETFIGKQLPKDVIAIPYSRSNRSTHYQVGEWVRPEYSFDKRNKECASGIHFFLNLDSALRWR